jgi:hypothetical protein
MNCDNIRPTEGLHLNEMKLKQCLRKSHMALSSDRSESEYLNPLLTQDSRKQNSKMFSTYCDHSRKHTSSSAITKIPTSRDIHSLILDKNEVFASQDSEPETPALNREYFK